MNKGVEDTDRAIDEFSRSIRLSPVDPEIGYALGGLAYALLRKGDYEKAFEDAHRSAREMPRWGRCMDRCGGSVSQDRQAAGSAGSDSARIAPCATLLNLGGASLEHESRSIEA